MGVTNFDEVKDGTGKTLTGNPQQEAITDITTDMASDANDDELKGKVNEILAALRAADIITE